MIALRADFHPSAEETLAVGIGQCIVTRDPWSTLASYGLGSCVAVAAWDHAARVAALIHILLPEPPAHVTTTSPARFATTGIPYLLATIEAAGGKRSRLRVVAAGGAQMLSALTMPGPAKGIGERNSALVSAMLHQAGIALVACDFGGAAGRTISLSAASGQVLVRVAGGSPREL